MPKAFAFEAAFDPESLAKIKEFDNWEPILLQELVKAHEKADSVLQVNVKSYMPWGPGPLMDSLEPQIMNPYASQLSTDLPYSWRREKGFSGRTDSLGRKFTNDPGVNYMKYGLGRSIPQIEKIFGTALDSALARLGVMNK